VQSESQFSISEHSLQQEHSSVAFSELLQQAQDATANTAAATAIIINTFFIIRFILRVKHLGRRKSRNIISFLQLFILNIETVM
jgi:hypothetical protein